jgi:hypothetical protein
MNGFDEPWFDFLSPSPYESACAVYSGGGLHTKSVHATGQLSACMVSLKYVTQSKLKQWYP